MARRPRIPKATGADDGLFRQVMQDVTPLKRRKPAADIADGPAARKAPPAAAPVTTKPAAKAKRNPTGTAAPSPPKPAPAERQRGDTAGIDRRTGLRFRRGQMPVEARLDLHGLTQAEAHRALDAFLAGQHAAGRRCVLVVTGKGAGREGGGVLRAAVPRWLNEAPNRERVLAFDHARRKDGGEGALYVLLRRQRV